MSKLETVLNELKFLDRQELTELIGAATRRRKLCRTFALSLRTKKCGKPECQCAEGQEHGPYCYVVYQDRYGGQRQRSLGRAGSEEERVRMASLPRPRWHQYRVSKKRLEACTEGQAVHRNWIEYELTPEEFEAHYGLPLGADLFDRPRRMTIDGNKFNKAIEKWLDVQSIIDSRWAIYGVSSLKGVKILDQLTIDGYHHSK